MRELAERERFERAARFFLITPHGRCWVAQDLAGSDRSPAETPSGISQRGDSLKVKGHPVGSLSNKMLQYQHFILVAGID
jgi:hypothetical protein